MSHHAPFKFAPSPKKAPAESPGDLWSVGGTKTSKSQAKKDKRSAKKTAAAGGESGHIFAEAKSPVSSPRPPPIPSQISGGGLGSPSSPASFGRWSALQGQFRKVRQDDAVVCFWPAWDSTCATLWSGKATAASSSPPVLTVMNSEATAWIDLREASYVLLEAAAPSKPKVLQSPPFNELLQSPLLDAQRPPGQTPSSPQAAPLSPGGSAGGSVQLSQNWNFYAAEDKLTPTKPKPVLSSQKEQHEGSAHQETPAEKQDERECVAAKTHFIYPSPLSGSEVSCCAQLIVRKAQAFWRGALTRRRVATLVGLGGVVAGQEVILAGCGPTVVAARVERLDLQKMTLACSAAVDGEEIAVNSRIFNLRAFSSSSGSIMPVDDPSSPFTFQPFAPGIFSETPSAPQTCLVLFLGGAAPVNRAAIRVQSLIRRMVVEFSVLPLVKQSARRTWVKNRQVMLEERSNVHERRAMKIVSKQLSALPRYGGYGSCLASQGGCSSGLSSSNSSGPPSGLHFPDKQKLAAVQMRMDNLVGLSVVKGWAQSTIEDALRYYMAGELLPVRHILLSGRLGTGRRTSAELIALTYCAIGVIRNDALCEGWAKARPGCVTFIDHVDENEDKEVAKALRALESAAEAEQLPAIVVFGHREQRSLASLGGKLAALQKREALKLHLPPFSSAELAQITLQRVAGSLSLSGGVTPTLMQQAIESRWSAGEREQRNVYIAFDMAEYLVHSSIIKETTTGRGHEQLKAAASLRSGGEGEASPQTLPLEISMLMEGCGRDLPGASCVDVESLGLPAALLAKEHSRAMHEASKDATEAAAGEDGGATAAVGDWEVAAERSARSAALARAEVKAAEAAAASAALRGAVDTEVESLVGLAGIKKWFEEMRGKVRFSESTGNAEILTNSCLNMILTGNPGTGKTTVARLMFKFLRAYGVLKKDVFVEVNALELKGEYVGHTAPKVIGTVRSALGGALFLDEAYALAGDPSSGGKSDVFSNEAVRTLLTEVENNRTSVMVILAGYREKMSTLMRADPGMPRRFPIKHHLPDYAPQELAGIVRDRAHRTYSMSLDQGVGDKLAEAFGTIYASEVSIHNGGLAVRLVDEAVGRFATRMDRYAQHDASVAEGEKDAAVKVLTIRDFDLEDHFDALTREATERRTAAEGLRSAAAEAEAEERRAAAEEREAIRSAALSELEGMVGFAGAKDYVQKLNRKVDFVRAGGSRKVLDTCLNLVLTGSPGVGKTTFARILHRVLYACGVLREDNFIEKNALQLKGQYIGQTSPLVSDAFAAAKGGTLFLDEAPSLATAGRGSGGRDSFASDAIATLLTEAENHRTDVLVVLAGYREPMGYGALCTSEIKVIYANHFFLLEPALCAPNKAVVGRRSGSEAAFSFDARPSRLYPRRACRHRSKGLEHLQCLMQARTSRKNPPSLMQPRFLTGTRWRAIGSTSTSGPACPRRSHALLDLEAASSARFP